MRPSGAKLEPLLESFWLSLEERGLSLRTVEIHQRTGRQFAAWLLGEGLSTGVEDIEPAHIRAFLAAEAARTSAASAHQHYRNLRVLFGWLAEEGERSAPDPMTTVRPPKVTEKIKPILSPEQLSAVLKTAEGQSFEARRDYAILALLTDTGTRVSGLGNLRLDDVDLRNRMLRVVLKGGDEHIAPLSRKTAAALDRYLRARARSRHADSPWLWLGTAGRDPGHFGTAGIQDMVARRGRQAGIEGLTPHWFRRTCAHMLLSSGMQEMDVARVAGWRSTAMVRRYAGALAAERAREAHARLSPMETLGQRR